MLPEADFDAFTQNDDALNTIASVINDELGKAGITHARTLAASCTARLARDLGGCYVPKGVTNQRVIRDAQIRALHDGTHDSVVSLARQFGLSEVHIYRILARRVQPRPFHPRRPS